MTDKELLELAAKAAGYRRTRYADNGFFQVHGWHEGYDSDWEYWNPLTDDGDEARLEAALCLHVEWHPGIKNVAVGSAEVMAHEPWGNDRQAARRRAGVRVAAAMAKE